MKKVIICQYPHATYAAMINTGMEEVITSRLLTFFVALTAAIAATYLISDPKSSG